MSASFAPMCKQAVANLFDNPCWGNLLPSDVWWAVSVGVASSLHGRPLENSSCFWHRLLWMLATMGSLKLVFPNHGVKFGQVNQQQWKKIVVTGVEWHKVFTHYVLIGYLNPWEVGRHSYQCSTSIAFRMENLLLSIFVGAKRTKDNNSSAFQLSNSAS